MKPVAPDFSLRQTVIFEGAKWIIIARPDVLQRHDLYNLAKPDPSGRISKLSETRVNVSGRLLQHEVDLCA